MAGKKTKNKTNKAKNKDSKGKSHKQKRNARGNNAKEVQFIEHGSITGIVDMTAQGYAYIVSSEATEDVYVSPKNLRAALHGDKVRIRLFAKREGGRIEGQVAEIIERNRTEFVGTMGVGTSMAFMIPDSRLMPYDIIVPLDKLSGALDGQKVIVRITEWPNRGKNPIGEVIKILGFPGENETEMHSILAESDLPYEFPEEVEQAAKDIPTIISQEEIASRRDFRGICTFTIDPEDAKDFDDALSLLPLDDNKFQIGIHIADVSYYIQPGSILDKEAIKRGTSVYLVDRTVPMLPEALCNNLCSLRPNEDKLCFSALFDMDMEGNIYSTWFGRSIIRSQHRFSYEEAQTIIDTNSGTIAQEIQTLHLIAQKLRTDRMKKGAINFDKPEPKFKLEEGTAKPLEVFYSENTTSHQLIEEFMLLANKKVAEFCSGVLKGDKPARKGKGKIGVFRIHDQPNTEKLTRFSTFLNAHVGYKIKMDSGKTIARSLNTVLAKVKGRAEESMITMLALRSMAKADYSTDNIGHYGLAFKYYSHFTSPIRRYPDIMTHRLLQYYLTGEGSTPNKDALEALCKQSSAMERKAIEAERMSAKYKQVEFMADKVGEVFEGMISGVTEWGIYVELDGNHCEGMIHIRELDDDFYIFDEDNYCIKGKRKGKVYQLGDKIKIRVAKANLQKRQLDYRLA